MSTWPNRSLDTPLYSLHERFWHWLQASGIIFLIVSGFAIHYPDRFGVLGSMGNSVRWHSWIAWALIVNAFLGLFYHLTAEKYFHFLPKVEDFTGAAISQIRFYLYGIFKGERHPLETDPRRKLNPLQKITYLILLNILLPFQICTGVLLWGADRWPTLLEKLGGLWFLAPAHTLGSYLFLSFFVGHIYLASTGPTPGTLLRAITIGNEHSPEIGAPVVTEEAHSTSLVEKGSADSAHTGESA
jgi:thiosulfate reductase cytochrome b subunit